MSDPVKIIECPRDAWQGLAGIIPADLKVDYLKALISAGFKHIDAVSFVSPKAVPQMADSEDVLKELVEAYPGFIVAGGGAGTNPVRADACGGDVEAVGFAVLNNFGVAADDGDAGPTGRIGHRVNFRFQPRGGKAGLADKRDDQRLRPRARNGKIVGGAVHRKFPD